MMTLEAINFEIIQLNIRDGGKGGRGRGGRRERGGRRVKGKATRSQTRESQDNRRAAKNQQPYKPPGDPTSTASQEPAHHPRPNAPKARKAQAGSSPSPQ